MYLGKTGAMPVAGGSFEQCYNAQAAVATGSLLVVATDVVQAPNDKGQVEPMLEKQRRQRRSLREGRRRTRDRDGPSAALPSAERALRAGPARAAKAHAGRGDGLSTEDAGRPGALRAAQADP